MIRIALFVFVALSCFGQSTVQFVPWIRNSPYVASGGSSPTPDLLWYKFTEGSGATAADSSGHSNTGTLTNASWVTGKSGFGIQSDGTNTACVSLNNVTYSTNKVTITCWVNIPSFTSAQQIIFDSRPNLNNNQTAFDYYASDFNNTGDDLVGNFAGCGTAAAGGASGFPQNQWVFLACWFDNSATAGTNWVFTNSVYAAWGFTAGNTGASDFQNNKMYLCGYSATNSIFLGKIDDFRAYTGLLTSNQVSQIYADPQ